MNMNLARKSLAVHKLISIMKFWWIETKQRTQYVLNVINANERFWA